MSQAKKKDLQEEMLNNIFGQNGQTATETPLPDMKSSGSTVNQILGNLIDSDALPDSKKASDLKGSSDNSGDSADTKNLKNNKVLEDQEAFMAPEASASNQPPAPKFVADPKEKIHTASAALMNSQNLKIAQEKILELESEIERVYVENEQLAAAGQAFEKKCETLSLRLDDTGADLEDKVSLLKEEKELLSKSLTEKTKKVESLEIEKKQLEYRVTTNIKKIRVRERELENRLELIKMEKSSISQNKDEIILDLKRQMDQASIDMETFQKKHQELNDQVREKKDILRRTIKTLKLALSMLENKDNEESLKKAD